METVNIKAAIEAMLFAKGEPIGADEMAAALELSRDETIKYITELTDDYLNSDRGIHIVNINGRYELATKKEFYTVLASLVSRDNSYKFTEAMLETLSIIAYRQPVTRTQVENIRGVGCSNQISRLVEFGLIYESGRLDAPGRPFLFSTTDEFLRRFNISSPDELPEISEDLIGQMKLEVENESPDALKENTSSESGDDDEVSGDEVENESPDALEGNISPESGDDAEVSEDEVENDADVSDEFEKYVEEVEEIEENDKPATADGEDDDNEVSENDENEDNEASENEDNENNESTESKGVTEDGN